MEYDRALFRVYERIMEDLNSTPSPLFVTAATTTDNNLALSPLSSTNRHDSRIRRQETTAVSLIDAAAADVQQDGNEESNNEREIGEHPSNLSRNEEDDNAENSDNRDGPRDRLEVRRGSQRAARDRRGGRLTISTIAAMQQRQRRRHHHQPLPFLLPIWFARKVDQLIVNYRNRHYQHYSSLLPGETSESTTSATVITTYFFAAARLLWSISRELAMLGGGSGSRSRVDGLYDSIATSPTSTAATALEQHRDDISHDIELVSSSHHSSTNIHDVDVEGGHINHPLSLDERSLSIDGLRRRSPNRHSSGRGRSEDVTTNVNASLTIPDLSTALSSTSSASNTTLNSYSSNEDTGSDSDDTSNSSSNDEFSNTNERQRQRNNNNLHNNDDGGCSQLHLYGAMRLSLSIAIIHIFILFALHVTYVGPYAFRDGNLRLRQQHQQRQLLVSTGSTVSTKSSFVNCIAYALSDRPISDRSKYMEKEDDPSSNKRRRVIAMRDMFKNYIYNKKDLRRKFSDPDDGTRYYPPRVLSESSSGNTSLNLNSNSILPTLGMDEILQIKIMYGGSCTGKCSRVHTVKHVEERPDSGGNFNAEEADKLSLSIDDSDNKDATYSSRTHASQASNNANITMNVLGDGKVQQLIKQMDNIDDQVKDDGSFSSPSYWEKVHYRFARGDALLHLDEKTVSLHNITYVNVTLTERCLSTGLDNGELTVLTAIGEALSQVYGMDSVIINQLMYGIRGTNGSLSTGFVQSMHTKERWGWNKEQLEEYEPHSFVYWMARKIGVLVMSAMAFFLITSVTSLIVRVLTSSGVVLMFPLFSLFREMGLHGADERILSQSYPWIGTARAAIGNQRIHPQSHLVAAHSFKIVLYYAMYEACQAAWSIVLYNKSIPQGLPVWIFGFCMIWEYFSMVFIRSALSVHFFPRLVLLYFISYHAYFYSVYYGFFDVALIPLFFFTMHAMLYTILGLEAPNAARGVINVECPREVYNRLSWQEPVTSLPAEWTVFLPLNSRVTSLHDRDAANGMAI